MGPACSGTGGQERRPVWGLLKAANCSQPHTGLTGCTPGAPAPPGAPRLRAHWLGRWVDVAMCCDASGAPETANNGVDRMEPAWPDAHSALVGPGCWGDGEEEPGWAPRERPCTVSSTSCWGPSGWPQDHPPPQARQVPEVVGSWWGHRGTAGHGAGPALVASAAPGPRGRTDSGHARQEARGVSGTSPHAGRARSAAWPGPSVGRTPGWHCLPRGLARQRCPPSPGVNAFLRPLHGCPEGVAAGRAGTPAPQRGGAMGMGLCVRDPSRWECSPPRLGPDLEWEVGAWADGPGCRPHSGSIQVTIGRRKANTEDGAGKRPVTS